MSAEVSGNGRRHDPEMGSGAWFVQEVSKRAWSSDIVEKAAKFAANRMSAYESGHGFGHVLRVHAVAGEIANLLESENCPVDGVAVELGALLHDVFDHKMMHDADLTDKEKSLSRADLFALHLRSFGVEDEKLMEHVVNIADGVSYSAQAKGAAPKRPRTVEMDVVQDADRVEALGAIGIARCFMYSGWKKRAMEDARAHYDEKLSKLLPLFRTEPGRAIAMKRSETMRKFFCDFDDEMNFAKSCKQ